MTTNNDFVLFNTRIGKRFLQRSTKEGVRWHSEWIYPNGCRAMSDGNRIVTLGERSSEEGVLVDNSNVSVFNIHNLIPSTSGIFEYDFNLIIDKKKIIEFKKVVSFFKKNKVQLFNNNCKVIIKPSENKIIFIPQKLTSEGAEDTKEFVFDIELNDISSNEDTELLYNGYYFLDLLESLKDKGRVRLQVDINTRASRILMTCQLPDLNNQTISYLICGMV
jgi:hypothetical protein